MTLIAMAGSSFSNYKSQIPMSSSYTKNALKVLKLFSSHIVEFLITFETFKIHS